MTTLSTLAQTSNCTSVLQTWLTKTQMTTWKKSSKKGSLLIAYITLIPWTVLSFYFHTVLLFLNKSNKLFVCRQRLFENLRMLPNAPGVQMHGK